MHSYITNFLPLDYWNTANFIGHINPDLVKKALSTHASSLNCNVSFSTVCKLSFLRNLEVTDFKVMEIKW